VPEGEFKGTTVTFGTKKYVFSNNDAFIIAQFLFNKYRQGSPECYSLSECLHSSNGFAKFGGLFKGGDANRFKEDYLIKDGRKWRFDPFKGRKSD